MSDMPVSCSPTLSSFSFSLFFCVIKLGFLRGSSKHAAIFNVLLNSVRYTLLTIYGYNVQRSQSQRSRQSLRSYGNQSCDRCDHMETRLYKQYSYIEYIIYFRHSKHKQLTVYCTNTTFVDIHIWRYFPYKVYRFSNSRELHISQLLETL